MQLVLKEKESCQVMMTEDRYWQFVEMLMPVKLDHLKR